MQRPRGDRLRICAGLLRILLDCANRRAYPACMLSRRSFAAGITALGARGLAGARAGELYQGYAIAPRPGVQEAILAGRKNGVVWLLFGEGKKLVRKISTDAGRTWGP